MRDYTKIVAWQKADDLTVAVYGATQGFPKEEMYALTSQLRRAAYSVPANIVEGATRETQRDYLHFLYIARGSLTEARYFLHLAGRLGYLLPEQQRSLVESADEVLRILAGLIRSVEGETRRVSRTVSRIAGLVMLSIGTALAPGLIHLQLPGL